MTLDAATRGLLKMMADSGAPPMHELSVAEARAMAANGAQMSGPGPQVAGSADREVSVDGVSVGVRILTPAGTPSAVLVLYHGGGWVHGGLAEYDHLGRRLAVDLGAVVVVVDYRLAPEHPFPAAIDDAVTALRWVCGHVEELADCSVPVIVFGDSAGGALAAVAARRARDENLLVHLQVLVYPVVDADLDRPGYLDPANQLMISRQTMRWYWDHYLPDLAGRVHPDASPLRADDLRGVAPAVIVTAEQDVLREEGEAYAAALAAADIPVRAHVAVGQMHGFLTMINILPGGAAGLEHLIAEIRDHLGLTYTVERP
ncbi:alpha/beta hydrolase [Amycolatopsis pigmentata]|uniref:Alpha/beta hydrolase n=1 Tax=Amycolatopsis pigmentata TaxID=450801 RepID=A0ABW5FIR5_9PSEU